MKLIDEAYALINDNEIQEETENFLADICETLLGDKVALGKILISLAKNPFIIREKIFWIKFERFLNGIDTNDGDRAMFCAKLMEDGKKKDNPYRLLQTIDRAETQQKVDYLINASRSLSAEFIDLPTYFRICNAIVGALTEDLLFLAKHIKASDSYFGYDYSETIQGLLNVGLVYLYKTDSQGRNKYKFTPFADKVDKYAVSFSDVERYPMTGSEEQDKERSIRYEVESSLKRQFFKP